MYQWHVLLHVLLYVLHVPLHILLHVLYVPLHNILLHVLRVPLHVPLHVLPHVLLHMHISYLIKYPVIYHQVDIAASASAVAGEIPFSDPLIRWLAVAGGLSICKLLAQ